MKLVLTSFLLLASAVHAQSAGGSPSQIAWSIFAVAAIIMLFITHHLWIEKKKGRKN